MKHIDLKKKVKTSIKKKTRGSLNAELAMKDLREKVRKREKINMQEIQKNRGYTKNSAKSMKIKETKIYKEEIKSVVEELETERDEAIKELIKKRPLANYGELTRAIDIMIKNIQLLGGKPTEIIKISPDKQNDIDNALDNL